MTYQINIFLRLLNATLGAYGFATLFSIALIPALIAIFSIIQADAVYYSLLFAYFVFFIIVIASFAMKSVKHLYLMMLSMTLLCVLAIVGAVL